jgi:transposase
MALGRRGNRQKELWVTTEELPRSPGHPFYEALNGLLFQAKFDSRVEGLCAPYYAETGRTSIPPGVYFRMLLVGYFEGITSQRGITWRCSDSLALRDFLGIDLRDQVPDHSSLTRIRKRLPLEIHHGIFLLVLEIARKAGLVQGKRVAVDSTTLEANAAMKGIVRRGTGEGWKQYLKRLLKEERAETRRAEAKKLGAGAKKKDDDEGQSGEAPASEKEEDPGESKQEPTDEEARVFDKRRAKKGKKRVSNTEWVSSSDPASKIARMKNGRTHLAYKAEHVVDLDSCVIVSAEIHRADLADVETLAPAILQAQTNLAESGSEARIQEVVADAGYHGAEALAALGKLGCRSYVCEPKSKAALRRVWLGKPKGWQKQTHANRARIRRAKSKRLQRLRSERVERTFAHVCGSGGGRRTHLRGYVNVEKRHLIQVAAHNLGAIMRKLFGVGTARSLQAGGAGTSWLENLLAVITGLFKLAIASIKSTEQLAAATRLPVGVGRRSHTSGPWQSQACA